MSKLIDKAYEGYITVTGGQVWYKVVNSSDAIPLLILHGGPGTPHDYLEPLEALADERPIVFYDQLGCGKSERPDDMSLWFSERFVEELRQIREALGLKQVHIFGHSWGSMLAVDYALTRPSGLVSLILASPPLCIARWLQDAADYRSRLPLEVQNILDRHEAAGTTDSEDYQWATMEYYRRHICRLNPWPDSLERARAAEGTVVYQTMWGPTEFFMTGNLLNYDRTARLHEINVPTLFTCGRYDEATPEATAWYQSFIPGSEMVCFEHSAHMPHLEETKDYLRVVRGFLDRVERR